MTRYYKSSYHNPDPYIPASLSEIADQLASMVLWAPTFDQNGYYPERNTASEFHILIEALSRLRSKLGEDRYAALIDRAERAKALFAADQSDDNGKTDQGRELLYEMEDLIVEARSGRRAAKLKDEDGKITGD